MIKYRLSEVAKDLNVSNKEAADVLKERLGVVKKSATVLTEDELNVIFEHFTQKNSVSSFDKYFASRDAEVQEEQSEPEKTETAEPKPEKKDKPEKSVRTDKQPVKNEKGKPQNRDGERRPNDKGDRNKNKPKPNSPQNTKAQAPKKNTANVQPQKSNVKPQTNTNTNTNTSQGDDSFGSRSRVINTRSSNVDIERYNEKYDRLASEKMHNENTVQKQKITQRSQQKGKPRNSRKETEQERLRRIEKDRKNKPITVQIPDEITVSELALRLKARAAEVIMKLMGLGVMATVNDTIDFDTASLAAMEFHAKVEKETVETIEEKIIDDSDDDDENLVTRAPVVVVMGHVDHGKTSLLDAIRKTNVALGEAGGITQHIGASEVYINGEKIVFLDTPGHEAFTAMRARGAHVTDIAVLVVAADDGVMPQTVESISHAKAAGVPIIVAINKIDKPGANPDRVKQELTEHNILVEDWGGDTICVPVSAKTGEGITNLLEMILLQAEVLELKANPNRMAKGSVVEARLDKTRGPVATLLVDNGTLRSGQSVVVGNCYGRIRLMTDYRGKKISKAGPATAVEILGLDDVPVAGDEFNAVKDDKVAREIAESRRQKLREEILARNASSTLEQLFSQIQEGEVKDLNLIIKADVAGSVEAIVSSLEKLSNENVRVKVVHTGVGTINESDVMLASTTGSIIIGFNVRPTTAVTTYADSENVQIRLYRVIYDIINEIQDAMKGMLDPEFKEEVLGKVEVRTTFKVPNVGTIAGAYVQEGKVVRNAEVRLVRDGIVIHEGTISSLKRFKDDAKEVNQGYECGIGIENYNDIKEGDTIECFHMVEVERK